MGTIVVHGNDPRETTGFDVVVAITRTLLIAGLTVGLAAGTPSATQAAYQDPPSATTAAQTP